MAEEWDVEALLPQRPPFLMVDRILELDPGRRAVTRRCVSRSDPVLTGHFPGYPIVPGVLLIETMAQTGAIAVAATGQKATALLAGVDHARFRRQVRPGDVLTVEVELIKLGRRAGRGRGRILADAEEVCSAEFLFVVQSLDAPPDPARAGTSDP